MDVCVWGGRGDSGWVCLCVALPICNECLCANVGRQSARADVKYIHTYVRTYVRMYIVTITNCM